MIIVAPSFVVANEIGLRQPLPGPTLGIGD